MIIIIITAIIKFRRHDSYSDYVPLLGFTVCVIVRGPPCLNCCHSSPPRLTSGFTTEGADACVCCVIVQGPGPSDELKGRRIIMLTARLSSQRAAGTDNNNKADI